MPAGPIKAKYVEKEHAVVDGVDISGHWNRMFEQRTIFEYTPELIEKIADPSQMRSPLRIVINVPSASLFAL